MSKLKRNKNKLGNYINTSTLQKRLNNLFKETDFKVAIDDFVKSNKNPLQLINVKFTWIVLKFEAECLAKPLKARQLIQAHWATVKIQKIKKQENNPI